MNHHKRSLAASTLVLVLAACSSTESQDQRVTQSTGGRNVGGVSSAPTGGASFAPTGGTGALASGGVTHVSTTTATGGSSFQTTGGRSTSTGGSATSSSGGSTFATGGTGTKATGGTSSATSTQASGGTSSETGGTGTKPSGGTSSAVGGTTAGGTSSLATGGSSVATLGGSSTGGKTGTAGASATGGSSSIEQQRWIGTWTASPYVDTNTANTPPISLSNSVVRQVTHISLGGSQFRFQFSNLRGNGSLTINAAHVALCKATPAVDSTIDTSTDTALAFSGKASVTIAQGQEVWSDPVDFTAPNQASITITTAFGSVPSTLTQHTGSRTTSYFQSNSTTVNAASMASAQTKDLWFFISGTEVMADASAKGIVVMGDSITDGRGTDTNKNNRWTDVLAGRLLANAATSKVTMMNQGIGATMLIGSTGTAAQARFDRDVLGQSGVKYVIIYDGVNDICSNNASFANMKSAYDDLIARGHAKGLTVIGATILPFNGNSYYTTAHESVRQQVNTYVRSGAFDDVIDFDAALKDPADATKLAATYAQWTQTSQTDWLHPGPVGYQKMGSTPDLSLFTK